jgi:hypothetical protein
MPVLLTAVLVLFAATPAAAQAKFIGIDDDRSSGTRT